MSTASPATRSRVADSPRPQVKADDLIRERISEACSALWWAELTRASLRIVIVWLIALLAWLVVDQWLYSPGVFWRVVALAALMAWTLRSVLFVVVPILRSSIRPEYAARSLERDNPQLHQSLTSYVTLQSDRAAGGLAGRVLRSIGSSAARQLRGHDQLPGEATGTLRWWIVAASALALLAAYAVLSPKNSFQSASRLMVPIASIDPAERVLIRDVQPGDAEAVAGRPVTVSALIAGMTRSDVARVRWQTGSAASESLMEVDPDSPRRIGAIDLPHSVSGTVDYFIEAGDATAGPFHLQVQNVPVVAVQSVRYEPPSYTGEVPHTNSSGAISAVDGTRVTLRATTNRAVTKAKIEFNPKPIGDAVRATAGATELEIADDGTVLTVSFPLRSAQGRSAAVELESYRVKVWDAAGQGNPDPIVYPIEVIADLPPEVSIVMPRQSPKEVPINAQQVIEVHSLDADYGLKRVALELRIGLALIDEPVLWSDPHGATGNRVCEYRFRPSQHGLQVGDKVQIRAIATDNRGSDDDPAIEPNVTRTDPIELIVVDVAPLPEDDAGGDGLSPPDDRPATDQSPPEQGDSQQQGGESGQQGGGQSGSGSESNEQGEGGQGGGEAAGDSNTSPGEENSGGENSDANSSSENQSGGGESSGPGDSSGQNATSDPQQDSRDASGDSAASGGDPSDRGAEAASTGDTPPPGGESQPQDAAPSSDASAADSASGESAGSEGDPSTRGQSPDGQPSPGNQGAGQPKPPQHDGEAMERIRDYLNKMENQANQQSSSQSSPSQNEAGEGRSPSDTSSSPDGESGHRNADGQQPPTGGGSSNSKPSDPDGAPGAGSDENQDSAGGRKPEAGDAESEGGGADPKNGESGGESPSGDRGESAQGAGNQQQDGGGTGEPDGSAASAAADSDATGQTGRSPQENGSPSGEGSKSPQGPSGDSRSPGEQGESEQGAGGEESPDAGDAGDKPGDAASDKPASESSTDNGTEGQSGGEDGTSGSEDGSSGSNAEPSDAGEGESSGQGQSDAGGTESSGASDPSAPEGAEEDSQSSENFSGSGSGGGGTAKAGDAPTPPDPVDLEYAKEATDMVLDYLDQTRDAPDRELLDELNWSEEDLKRFADRWNNVRSMQRSAQPGENRDVEEALKSLGMRKPTEATQNRREAADELRGVRDAGNRRPVPAAHRDAFEAFRRAIGKQRQANP